MIKKFKDIDLKVVLEETKHFFQIFVLNPFIYLLKGEKRITNIDILQDYIQRKSAFITQETLFGYLKTRIGTNYVKMYDNDDFVASINIAKWNIYLIAIQDMLFFAFSYLYAKNRYQNTEDAKILFQKILDKELHEKDHPLPSDIYQKRLKQFEERIQNISWMTYYKEDPFKTSSESLHYWAPVADELKNLDKAIVINSMQLKWQNIVKEFIKINDINIVA
ncbi:MAG: esterase [Proteobacteria bacterium]|nr:esterase [Pseudomonadota bacterium]